MRNQKTYTIGITGASGSIYGVRLIQELLRLENKVHLVITEAGWQVLSHELNWDASIREANFDKYFTKNVNNLIYHQLGDFNAPIASGSYQSDGMIVIPCSMGTLSKIAHGISSNLLERTADVMLKEGKQLIIVPRETPLNAIHLDNMLILTKAGARLLPAMPGFYHNPKSIDDLVDYVVGKVLDSLGFEHSLFKRWGV